MARISLASSDSTSTLRGGPQRIPRPPGTRNSGQHDDLASHRGNHLPRRDGERGRGDRKSGGRRLRLHADRFGRQQDALTGRIDSGSAPASAPRRYRACKRDQRDRQPRACASAEADSQFDGRVLAGGAHGRVEQTLGMGAACPIGKVST